MRARLLNTLLRRQAPLSDHSFLCVAARLLLADTRNSTWNGHSSSPCHSQLYKSSSCQFSMAHFNYLDSYYPSNSLNFNYSVYADSEGIVSGCNTLYQYQSRAKLSGLSNGVLNQEQKRRCTPNPSWIDVYLPQRLSPYAHLARLDKPIGTWLLAWPCMWSICLAAPNGSLPDFKMMSLFGLGALLLRGAGCTVNDLIDRDIDPKVQRTKSRPIANGVLSPFQGLSFLGFQLLLGLCVLLQLNNFSRLLGASSLLLVGSYPLMKRVTFWPQAYLGLTFNWGALLGWAAIKGDLDFAVVIPLYLSGICWTLVYDTIYAHQDKEDDLKVGVKSTALRFGDQTKSWLAVFGIGCISCLYLSGFNTNIGWPFYLTMTTAAGHLAWQILTVDISSRSDCNKKFVANKWFGALVFGSILLGKLSAA